MGAMKAYWFAKREAESMGQVISVDLWLAARALRGEITPRGRVAAPSPGEPSTDRSLVVCVYRDRPPWIYAHKGGLRAAKEYVATVLGPTFAHINAATASKNKAKALEIWNEASTDIEPVVKYLRSRSITVPAPPTLRFHPNLYHAPTQSRWPAMVALVTHGIDDTPLAIHRTYLARDFRGKAPLTPEKMMLGPCAGGAVRLAPVKGRLLIGEGIETSLAAMQLTGYAAWAALSTSGMKVLDLPPEVRDVVALADNDEHGAGQQACLASVYRWKRIGGRVVNVKSAPRGFNDFNDFLMASENEQSA